MSRDHLKGEGDRFLIAEIRVGSGEAFRRLVDRFSGRLKSYAARKLQGSGIDPEDAVQDTFLSLLRSIDRLEGVRSLQAYLYTILRCRIADLARARGPMGGAVSLDAGSSSGGIPVQSPESTPSSYARREEAVDARRIILADALEALLSRLKEERKFRDLKILELVFALGRSHQEAARIAQTSEPTVSRTRKAAVEQLRKLVRRHARADSIEDLPEGDDVTALITSIWEENLFSCLKRSTLGSYALGVLDADWSDYVRFHLQTANCEYCAAHLHDVEKGAHAISARTRERILMSSAGFLK